MCAVRTHGQPSRASQDGFILSSLESPKHMGSFSNFNIFQMVCVLQRHKHYNNFGPTSLKQDFTLEDTR